MIKKSCQFFSRGEQILTENCLFAYFRSFQAHHGSMVSWDISTRHGSMVCVEISLRGWGHIQKNPKRHALKFDPFRGFAWWSAFRENCFLLTPKGPPNKFSSNSFPNLVFKNRFADMAFQTILFMNGFLLLSGTPSKFLNYFQDFVSRRPPWVHAV